MVRIFAAIGVVLIFAVIMYMWWRLWNHPFLSGRNRKGKGEDNSPGFEPGDELEIRTHRRGRRVVRVVGFTNAGKVLVDYGGVYFRRHPGTLWRLRVE